METASNPHNFFISVSSPKLSSSFRYVHLALQRHRSPGR
jgi:hypothetical protein